MSTIWAAAVPYPASTNDTTMTSSLPTCTSMRRSLANGARSRHHERAEVAVAMEHAHRAARAGAPRLGGRKVDHPARIDEDAVILPGRVDGHEAAHDVAADALERTSEGMAPGAAAVASRPAGVLVQRVAAQAQGKHHLHELGGVVFLGHVIDGVEAVGERARAIAHRHAVAAQEELVARAVEAAQEVDVVDRVR